MLTVVAFSAEKEKHDVHRVCFCYVAGLDLLLDQLADQVVQGCSILFSTSVVM
jgi:hypothetical protein